MKTKQFSRDGSTLVVTIVVVATMLVLLAVAVNYTTQISRMTDRSRKTSIALEIADGHLEALFTNWRNIYRNSWTTTASQFGGSDTAKLGTSFFYTSAWAPAPAPTPLPQDTPPGGWVGATPTPAPTPPIIPTPAPSQFASGAAYTLDQYRIQAVDPMITLNSSGEAMVEGDSGRKGTGGYVLMNRNQPPPGAYGPNSAYGYMFPYSFFYLASVDVSVPVLNGVVTAKVRRVFEKKFELPWSYMMFFVDDLELQPSSQLIINGPIHTNANLYITTSNFVAANQTYNGTNYVPTSGRVEYGGEYVNGYSPKDSRYPGSGFTTPTFAKSDASLSISDCPPTQVSPYLPFGWNLSLSTASSSGVNNDSYREIIEPPVGFPKPPASSTDPLAHVRYYNQASVKILISENNNIRVFRADTTNQFTAVDPSKEIECTASSTGNDQALFKLFASSNGAITTNLALYDAREGVNVRIVDVDIAKITAAVTANNNNPLNNYSGLTGILASQWNGVIYIADTTPAFEGNTTNRKVVSNPMAMRGSLPVSTSERAIRLINGHALPAPAGCSWNTTFQTPTCGLTVVSNNPVYIKGNYNTGGTSVATSSPPSNTTTTGLPTVQSPLYTRKPSCVVGDSINVLSGNWTDANSATPITGGGYLLGNPRSATSTTVNTAIVAGHVPTSSAGYSGGGETFIRLQEDWRTQNFVYYGSMVQLYKSLQGKEPGSAGGNFHKNPASTRLFYDYETFGDNAPPGKLIIAAYLQQQRWYQVY